jgi:hypothetical protein
VRKGKRKMTNEEFLKFCKEEVKTYTNTYLNKTNGTQITTDDVFVVWFCKTLQNRKALVTTLNNGMYYEITHDGDRKQTYVDVYKKWENYTVKDSEL